MNLPHPWGEYARLQALSSRKSTIDSFSWGLEEEMNLFLDNPAVYTPETARHFERHRATAARRERSRAQLREIHIDKLAVPASDPVPQLEAREVLSMLESRVTSDQWALMMAVAQGHDYADISHKQAIGIGAARAQMWRLRQQFIGLGLAPAA